MRRLLLFSGILLLLFPSMPLPAHAPPTPASERERWNQPDPGWWEGPVRYALTDAETREYRSLDSKARRAAFIARFWAARDLDPFSPGNEVEDVFWQRVSAADALFAETTIAGWRTDQGRVYIVLGPPNEITNYPLPSLDELDPSHFPDPYQRWPAGDLRPGHRGAVVWTYRGLKNPRADPQQEVTFTRDETGEYHLSRRLASSFRFEPAAFSLKDQALLHAMARSGGGARQQGNAFTRSAGTGGTSRVSDPDAFKKEITGSIAGYQAIMDSVEDSLALEQADLFEKAEPPSGAATRVSTAQFFGVIPLQNRLDYFQGTGGTTTLITLGVPSDDLKAGGKSAGSLDVFGRLESVDDPTHVYQFSTVRKAADAVPLQEVGGREHRVYEVRGTVAPGEYKVNFGVKIGERIGAVGDRVRIPDFGGADLRMAGPVLSEKVGEVSSQDASRGFTLGTLKLLPKLEPVFAAGAELGFYFQVYHAGVDPGDGRPHLDIEYSVSVRRKGLFVPQGKPVTLADNPAPAHAFVFPLQDWPDGEYLLTVTVTDRTSGRVLAGTAPFRVQ